MNGAILLPLNNLVLTLPTGLQHSSNSVVEKLDEIQGEIIADKFELLRKNIGQDLFDQLSYSDKLFMIETAGAIDFGREINLDIISKGIREYDDQ